MTNEDRELRMTCLRMSVQSSRGIPDIELAQKIYDFLREGDADVVQAAHDFAEKVKIRA